MLVEAGDVVGVAGVKVGEVVIWDLVPSPSHKCRHAGPCH
jgi:hypothetical protein